MAHCDRAVYSKRIASPASFCSIDFNSIHFRSPLLFHSYRTLLLAFFPSSQLFTIAIIEAFNGSATACSRFLRMRSVPSFSLRIIIVLHNVELCIHFCFFEYYCRHSLPHAHCPIFFAHSQRPHFFDRRFASPRVGQCFTRIASVLEYCYSCLI